MDGGDLRFGLIKDRLNLCLLIRGQVQLLGDSLKAKPVAVPTRASLSLQGNQAAKCNRTDGYNC